MDAGQRAPILKAYLQCAPVAEIENIAAQYPVFRVEQIKELA